MVLLHVVSAPRGVHDPVHRLAGQRPVEHVEDVAPSSTTATTRASPSVPVSQGWPPLSA